MIFKDFKIGVYSVGLFCLFALTAKEGYSQKFIIGYGLSVYTDYVFIAPQLKTEDGTSVQNTFGASVLSLSAEMKYNLHEFNSDLAFSIASSPSLGFMALNTENSTGFGNLRLPLYAQLDYGNLSTFESMKNFGVGIGIGYEYDSYGLFGDGDAVSLGTVAARLGLRYFNRNNKSREVAIKFAFPKTVSQEYSYYDYNMNEDVTESVDVKVTGIQLSWILYFNY